MEVEWVAPSLSLASFIEFKEFKLRSKQLWGGAQQPSIPLLLLSLTSLQSFSSSLFMNKSRSNQHEMEIDGINWSEVGGR